VPRRSALASVALAAIAAVAAATPALAFDKVDTLKPVAAGHGYVYYIREVDAAKQPMAGRTVTMRVGRVPGSDAAVAACDAGGRAIGPVGASATEQSGSDGLAYFLLRTSATPGQNEFIWTDTTWTGEVLVTGTGTAPASPPPAAAGVAHGARGGPGAAPPSLALPGRGVPPLAAGLFASALVWLAAPAVLARRRRRAAGDAPVPSLSDRLPQTG